MDIRKNLRKLVEASGMGMGEVAKAAGISNPYMSQLLNHHKHPSADVLDRIARVLGVTVDDILHADTGSIGVPEQKHVASCIRCSSQKSLSLVPHRLKDEAIVGWLFACQRCAKYVYEGTVAVTYHSAS